MLQSLKNCESELTHFLRRDPYPPIMSDRCAQLPNNKLPNKLAIELRNIHPKCVDRTQSFARAHGISRRAPNQNNQQATNGDDDDDALQIVFAGPLECVFSVRAYNNTL